MGNINLKGIFLGWQLEWQREFLCTGAINAAILIEYIRNLLTYPLVFTHMHLYFSSA